VSVRILLADDHKIVRDGLRALIDNEPDLQVVAETEDGRSAIRLADELSPDVIILDIGMPDLNGIEAARRIIGEHPHIKVVGLSMHSDRRFVSEMLRAGASGYLLKDCAFEELTRAIKAVMANEIYLSPKIAGTVIEDYVNKLAAGDTSSTSLLTHREREVLQLLAEGKSTKQIAYLLKVSVKTIETHRQNIMRKLDVYSVAELTKYAVREGLTSLEP
jgi:two-component system response regulator NreC